MEVQSGASDVIESAQDSVIEGSQLQEQEQSQPETEETQEQDSQSESQEEVLPFGKHPRWQKMNEQNRDYRRQIREFQERERRLEGPRAIHEALSKNPQHLRMVMDLLTGNPPVGEQEDPYAEWDPIVASKFKDYDALKAKVDAFEQRQAQDQQQFVQNNEQTLLAEFSQVLKADGYTDPKTAKIIGAAMDVYLEEQGINASYASVLQMREAYNAVVEGLAPVRNKTLRDVSNQRRSSIPASGSGQGGVAISRGPETAQDRVARMMAAG